MAVILYGSQHRKDKKLWLDTLTEAGMKRVCASTALITIACVQICIWGDYVKRIWLNPVLGNNFANACG